MGLKLPSGGRLSVIGRCHTVKVSWTTAILPVSEVPAVVGTDG